MRMRRAREWATTAATDRHHSLWCVHVWLLLVVVLVVRRRWLVHVHVGLHGRRRLRLLEHRVARERATTRAAQRWAPGRRRGRGNQRVVRPRKSPRVASPTRRPTDASELESDSLARLHSSLVPVEPARAHLACGPSGPSVDWLALACPLHSHSQWCWHFSKLADWSKTAVSREERRNARGQPESEGEGTIDGTCGCMCFRTQPGRAHRRQRTHQERREERTSEEVARRRSRGDRVNDPTRACGRERTGALGRER